MKKYLIAAAVASLALIVLDWSNAFRGAFVDVAILAAVIAVSRLHHWF